MLHLQLVIEREVPDARLYFKYRIPFYYHSNGKPFCYFNQARNYVDLGFYHGAHFGIHRDKLISENRKQVRSLRYYSTEDIDEKILVDLLMEGVKVKDRPFYS